METKDLDPADAIVLATDAAIEQGDKAAVELCLGGLKQQKIELDRQYGLVTGAEMRARNFIVTGDPSVIPNVPESS